MKENSVMTKEKARELARALVGQMTVEEKASQLLYNSPAIERLGIHDYNWWNEASHGVARSGMATVFPHAIGLASTFNPDLIGEVGEAVSTEARAKSAKPCPPKPARSTTTASNTTTSTSTRV